jgi:serine/threonine protein kinase
VLIAPFSSEGALDAKQTGWQLKLHDLWQLLHRKHEPTRNIMKHLDGVYQLLHGVHRDGRVRCGRKLFDYRQEYSSYLRGLHTHLSSIPATLFGMDERTIMFGLTWPNPVQVLHRVLALPPIEGACGPVHGDLHPKNIVLDKQMQPSIIDFGWAQRQGHLVRDYALMEVNLRAMTLPSHVPFGALLSHAREFAPGIQPYGADAIIRDRSNLIRRGIWARMTQQGVVESWDWEYVVPLFMVAFGLLKHLDSARNLMALLLTVLGLAAYVTDILNGQSKQTESEVVLS